LSGNLKRKLDNLLEFMLLLVIIVINSQKMIETSDINEIIRLINGGSFQLICIDGIDGSGKSTLAANLSQSLGVEHLNLDDFVKKEKGNFVKFIDLDKLKDVIGNSSKLIIIEGVCLLEIISKLNRSIDLLIYIKRISGYGTWYDEDECEISGEIEEFIQKKKEYFKKICISEAQTKGYEFNEEEFLFPTLREEILRYHYKYGPHKKADVIFIRNDCRQIDQLK